jgi:hypothetical protein
VVVVGRTVVVVTGIVVVVVVGVAANIALTVSADGCCGVTLAGSKANVISMYGSSFTDDGFVVNVGFV